MRRDLKIATATMSKLSKGEEASLWVLLRVCEYLDSDIGDNCSVIKQKKEKVALLVLLCICEYLDPDIGDICSVIKQKKEDAV